MMTGYKGKIIEEENDTGRIGTVDKIKKRL